MQFGNLIVTIGGPGISPSHCFELQNKKPKSFSSTYHEMQATDPLSLRFPQQW